MQTDLKRMGCGNCGGIDFKIYTKLESNQLTVECNGCKSTSTVKPSKPSLVIEFGEDSDGCLAVDPTA